LHSAKTLLNLWIVKNSVENSMSFHILANYMSVQTL